jgi:5-methylcytosine-specific restriction endonuclease McrA
MLNKKLVRKIFRDSVFSRDGHKCKKCGSFKDLDPHHITDRNEMPNGGYAPENGIALCSKCHENAEVWHKSGKKMHVKGFHPNELYALIGSSYEKAVKSCEEIK